MANEALSAPASAWNSLYKHYLSLVHKLDHSYQAERDELECAIAAMQELLLATPAPTLSAIAEKLEILFEGEMHGLDQASKQRLLLLADVRLITSNTAFVRA